VKFAFTDSQALAKVFGAESNLPASIVIWTTTPWTLPANEAVSVHPTLEYSLVKIQRPEHEPELLVLATALVEEACERYGSEVCEILGRATGADFGQVEGQAAAPFLVAHPFMDKNVPII